MNKKLLKEIFSIKGFSKNLLLCQLPYFEVNSFKKKYQKRKKRIKSIKDFSENLLICQLTPLIKNFGNRMWPTSILKSIPTSVPTSILKSIQKVILKSIQKSIQRTCSSVSSPLPSSQAASISSLIEGKPAWVKQIHIN